MIAFACRCKHRFALPDDQAGGVIQCPQCGRLNDVPTLDDLPHLDADGVFDVYAERPADDGARLAELGYIYAKGTLDADGDEIDLRGGAPVAAPEEIPLADEEPPAPPRPKYDPETGELIRPLELREDPDRPAAGPAVAIPLAQPAIGYAMPDTDFRRISPRRMLVELFAPPNMMVMAFVAIFCLMLIVTAIVVNFGFVFVAIAPLLLLMTIVAHFGATVEEIGPEQQDELPRVLRSFSWYDDLWNPFQRVVTAHALLFWPLYAAASLPRWLAFGVILFDVAAGLFLLPAVLLTLLTGGTWLNLRPDRVLGVIRACGRHYLAAVLGGVASWLTFPVGLVSASVAMWNGFAGGDQWGLFGRGYVAFPLLLTGIYAAHAWAWYLGLMYRAHHGQFPWVLQRHVSTRLTSFDPSTDLAGRPRRPRRTTAEKIEAARAANTQRYGTPRP